MSEENVKPEEQNFVPVCRFRNRVYAEMVAEILTNEGIPCYVKGDDSSIFGVAGFGGQDQMWPAILLTTEEHVDYAREICQLYADSASVKRRS